MEFWDIMDQHIRHLNRWTALHELISLWEGKLSLKFSNVLNFNILCFPNFIDLEPKVEENYKAQEKSKISKLKLESLQTAIFQNEKLPENSATILQERSLPKSRAGEDCNPICKPIVILLITILTPR